MDIRLNAAVGCADGPSGRSTCVIINPTTQELTHLVVKAKRLPHTERFVPIDWVEESTPELIRLRCNKDVTITVSQMDGVVEGTNYPKLDKQAVESLGVRSR